MKKKFKLLSIVMALTVGAALLPACAKEDAGKSSGAPTAKKEIKKLDFVWFSDGVEGDVTKAIIKDYQDKNPNIQINLIEVPFKDLETKLKMMVAGGEPPALSRVSNVSAFKNSLVDLSKYVPDKEKFTGQFIDSVSANYQIDGKVLAAPIDVTANGLIYNKTAFAKAGVSVPTSPDKVWTWDESINAMKQVMDKGGVKYGMVMDKSTHRWSTLLYQFGGSMLNDDGTKVVLNSPEAVQAVDLMTKLHQDKIIPESVWVGSENPNDLFRTGQVALHFAGSWMMTNYRDNIKDFEWGVTYMPQGKMRSSVPGGKYIAAFQNSKVEKEAADFIQYFTSKEVNAKYCVDSLFLSPRKDNAELNYSFGKDFFKIFADELKNTSPKAAKDWAHPSLTASISNDLRDGVVEAIAGKSTAKNMLDKVAAKGQKAIDPK